jgi:hypothetical protein
MSNWIWTLIIISLVILIIYIVGSLASGGSIIKSICQQNSDVPEADQLYYLPTACLLIKATATVIVTKDTGTKNIIDTKLSEITFDSTVQIVPDTRSFFSIKYTPSFFSNDDLKLSINSSGLIEGINLTAEDRIANIIAEVAVAPKTILSADEAEAKKKSLVSETSKEGVTVITETKQYNNNFFILTNEIRKENASRRWIINVDGASETDSTVDASFRLKFDIPSPGSFLFKDNFQELEGILLRPLQTIIMSTHTSSCIPPLQYQLLVPDESKVVSISIKRSAFVKKVYGFKMTNGMLTENTINKPSEMEGFMSIPIKIAKAIVSIPAQIISFKIENIKHQTSLVTEQQNLSKAVLQKKKNRIDTNDGSLSAKTK